MPDVSATVAERIRGVRAGDELTSLADGVGSVFDGTDRASIDAPSIDEDLAFWALVSLVASQALVEAAAGRTFSCACDAPVIVLEGAFWTSLHASSLLSQERSIRWNIAGDTAPVGTARGALLRAQLIVEVQLHHADLRRSCRVDLFALSIARDD